MTRTVLVTGAATGIGRATAELFAREGWRVGWSDVDGGAARRAAEGHADAVPLALDVTDATAWDAALDVLTEPTGRLDVLVNNAGVLAVGPLEQTPLALLRGVVDVNVGGVVTGCHTASPYLGRGSCVVNLCSTSSLYGQPGMAVYSATKAAVAALTEALELEWRDRGVRVVDVQPGYVSTQMADQAAPLASFRRLGVQLAPDDVARVVRAAVDGRGGPHLPVGPQARMLALASRPVPQALRRAMTARLVR